jgi:hypothetical protein
MWQHLSCARLHRYTGGCDAEDASWRASIDLFDIALHYHSQKVMKSNNVKDAGHAIIDQTDVDDIINSATTQGIYDLTPGLLNKERWMVVSGKMHESSAITCGEAREGLMEAHNFLSGALIMSTHMRNKKREMPAQLPRPKA